MRKLTRKEIANRNAQKALADFVYKDGLKKGISIGIFIGVTISQLTIAILERFL